MEMGTVEPSYLMEPIFPQKGTAVLAGKPDIGKSQFARQLCIQVALGLEEIIGFQIKAVHNRSIYVATEDNEIIGYGGIALAGDVADIHTLTVIPSYRRRGIATEILHQLEAWATSKGITAFMLEMREGNLQAQPLYEKHGYSVISRRDNYYSPGIHALIMRKEAGK